MSDKDVLTISCVLAWSINPTKRIIAETALHNELINCEETIIKSLQPPEMRGFGHNIWRIASIKLSRPLQTIVLHNDTKNETLEDVNEYLSQETVRCMLTVEFYIVVVISSMVLPDWKDFL